MTSTDAVGSDALPTGTIDAVVIGGGAAGLNGALMLGRSRRSVVVIDSGTPRNAPADAVHGLLGLEGTPPGELLERGRAELRHYGGSIVAGEVSAVRPAEPSDEGDPRFAVELADGSDLTARRLLVATGVRDELPDIPGLAEHWGHSVVHCPYCHGWEVRDEPIGIIARGPASCSCLIVPWIVERDQRSHSATAPLPCVAVPTHRASAPGRSRWSTAPVPSPGSSSEACVPGRAPSSMTVSSTRSSPITPGRGEAPSRCRSSRAEPGAEAAES